MRSFLGVPICAAGEVIGAFYLTDKEDADEFSRGRPGADRAARRARRDRGHERAPLRAQPRALDPRRAQPAGARAARRDLAEAVRARRSTAESADTLLDVDVEAAREQIDRLRQLSQEALEELRYLILELRPPELERDGLATTLRKHVEVLRRVQGGGPRSRSSSTACRRPRRRATASCCGSRRRRCRTRSSTRARRRIVLRLGTADGRRRARGAPTTAPASTRRRAACASRRLGLSSMEERARRLGGQLDDRLAAGEGTTVRLEAPLA